MSEYTEFSLLDEKGVERNVKMNKDDANEVYLWRERWGNRTLKPPRFRPLHPHGKVYKSIKVGGKHYKLHRVCYYAHNPEWDIYDNSDSNMIDHKDKDKQNNHISNLRIATGAQNQQNRLNTKGYSYHIGHKRFEAHIRLNGELIGLGGFENEEDARNAYLEAKAKYHTFGI